MAEAFKTEFAGNAKFLKIFDEKEEVDTKDFT